MNNITNPRSPAAATIHPALSRVYRTGAATVDAQLVELADQFHKLAMTIDPSITGCWYGRDMTIKGRREGAFQSIFFERAKSPLVTRKGGAE